MVNIKEEIWGILEATPGLYVVIADLQSCFIELADNEFLNDMGYNLDELNKMKFADLFEESEDNELNVPLDCYITNITKDGYGEVTSHMKKADGSIGPLVRWFTLKVNSNFNVILSLGIPLLKEYDKEQTSKKMMDMFKSMIVN